MAIAIIFGSYGMFVALMFFQLQDIFIVFKPDPGTKPLKKSELIHLIEYGFTTPFQGRNLFDVVQTDEKVIITWASSIDYFQITNIGGSGKKRVVILSFDEEKHKVFFLMKDKDWKWNAAVKSLDFSMNFSMGIFSENTTEFHPSIDFSLDQGIKADIKKLSYNSNELWHPIQKAVLFSGWSLHGGMIPRTAYRILLSLPVALLFFGAGLFFGSFSRQPEAPYRMKIQSLIFKTNRERWRWQHRPKMPFL